MANVTLKVSQPAYEAKITRLQDYLNRLDTQITNYETKKTQIDEFLDSTDVNYEKVRENIQEQIDVCRHSKELCDAAIQMLQQTLSEMTDAGQNIGNLLNKAGETAKSGLNLALDVWKLTD